MQITISAPAPTPTRGKIITSTYESSKQEHFSAGKFFR